MLASARSPGGGRAGSRLREALVILQFAIAIAFSIGMAVIVSQAAYLHRADLGFQRQGLIEVDSFPHQALTARTARQPADRPGARTPAWSPRRRRDSAPAYGHRPFLETSKRPGAPEKGPIIHFASIGPDFLQTFLARGCWPAGFPTRAAPPTSPFSELFLVSPRTRPAP